MRLPWAGYLPIDESLYTLPGRTMAQRFEWTYEARDDVLVPRMHRRRYLTLDGSTTRFDRTVTLVQSQLNQPIPADTFTAAHLGLEEGDRLVDHIGKTLTVFHGGKLVPPNDGRGSPWDRFWRIALFSSPTILLVMGIVLQRQRRRARRVAYGS